HNQSFDQEDVLILDFKQAFIEQSELFTTIYKNSDFIHFNHLFDAFVMSFLTDSLFIYIPENIQIKEPLELSFIQNNQLEKTINIQVYKMNKERLLIYRYKSLLKQEQKFNTLLQTNLEKIPRRFSKELEKREETQKFIGL